MRIGHATLFHHHSRQGIKLSVSYHFNSNDPGQIVNRHKDHNENELLPAAVLALRQELADGTMQPVKTLKLANCNLQILHGSDSVWILLTRDNNGGFALRTAFAPSCKLDLQIVEDKPEKCRLEADTPIGAFEVEVFYPNLDHRLFECLVSLTPEENIILPPWARDLYPLSVNLDPIETIGTVHAAQRGLNGGVLYLSMSEPAFGSLLYYQSYTSLNDYFKATETTNDGRVGGKWPQLGYCMPVSETKPLPAGKKTVLSDVFLHWTSEMPKDGVESARIFLDLLAGVYQHIERPESLYHEWPLRAEETLRDLAHSKKATVEEYGCTYLHPYTDAEYPDSMVQLAVLLPIIEYQDWKGKPISFGEELRQGVRRFYDPKLKTVRRYLPNVGKDKNKNEVDSWYLYHPLANLGRLALGGDKEAEEMFLSSLGYAIKVARHFKYSWPVQFDVETLEIIKGDRKECEPGQSDAGGLYAFVMLQAWQLTEEKRYLDEAKKSIKALADYGFSVCYQSNITAWGADACIWLWRITSDNRYRDLSYLMLASFFHNSLVYESYLAAAQHYPIFFGVTCLHDGPYLAVYECFESYAAFHEYLSLASDNVPESVRLLLTEYCKYTSTRAWFYYPSELPEHILSEQVRNGVIDRALAIPLEDVYADGKAPGQVGQEIYGCGAAFVFTTRAFHNFDSAPFRVFCEYPIHDKSDNGEPCINFQVRGLPHFKCRARLIPLDSGKLPNVRILEIGEGSELAHHRTKEGHLEFEVRGGSRIEIRWETK